MQTSKPMKRVSIKALDAPLRAKASGYPEKFIARLAGREKRPLGDLFDLTNFGVNLTRLAPGAAIPAHIDDGAPATYYTRYQLALQSLPGALMKIGEEVVNFRMGEVWQIDNRTEHSVVNNSADDRIALIIDVRGPVC